MLLGRPARDTTYRPFQKVGTNVQFGADLLPGFFVNYALRRYAFVWNELARTL